MSRRSSVSDEVIARALVQYGWRSDGHRLVRDVGNGLPGWEGAIRPDGTTDLDQFDFEEQGRAKP